MAQQITPFSISAPGFYGLNLQDSPVDLEPNYALIANNCIIDKYGRIAARMGWASVNTSNTELGSNPVSTLGEVVETSGTTTIVAAGNGYLYKLSGTTLTTLTYGGGGSTPTISADNWQFCQLNGVGIFWQSGQDPLIYDPAVSTTTYRRLSEKSGSAGTIYQCNTAISAYGRIWAADISTNKNTVYWSDVLTPHIWSGGSSGSLNLHGVWPKGGDNIVALAAHNNQLIIFGERQTLIYTGADTPSSMTLSDAVDSIGCIARDSIQNTGTDLIFLSDSGVRSLARTIQEKSAPLRDISLNVRTDILDAVQAETLANVKSVYSPINAFYLLTFPASSVLYCFDMRAPLPNGAARVTTWTDNIPTAFLQSNDLTLYLGKDGYIATYSSYLDNASTYRMSYYTTWIDFGNPINLSILKKILLTVIGATDQSIIFKWAFDYDTDYSSYIATITGTYDVAEYGIAEYGIAEYGSGGSTDVITAQGGGAGVVIQFGFESEINGSQLSLQKISIFTKEGRL